MEIRVKLPDGTWKRVDLDAELISRRTANNTWYKFDASARQVVSKKVGMAWEDQVPKVRYRY